MKSWGIVPENINRVQIIFRIPGDISPVYWCHVHEKLILISRPINILRLHSQSHGVQKMLWPQTFIECAPKRLAVISRTGHSGTGIATLLNYEGTTPELIENFAHVQFFLNVYELWEIAGAVTEKFPVDVIEVGDEESNSFRRMISWHITMTYCKKFFCINPNFYIIYI